MTIKLRSKNNNDVIYNDEFFIFRGRVYTRVKNNVNNTDSALLVDNQKSEWIEWYKSNHELLEAGIFSTQRKESNN